MPREFWFDQEGNMLNIGDKIVIKKPSNLSTHDIRDKLARHHLGETYTITEIKGKRYKTNSFRTFNGKFVKLTGDGPNTNTELLLKVK